MHTGVILLTTYVFAFLRRLVVRREISGKLQEERNLERQIRERFGGVIGLAPADVIVLCVFVCWARYLHRSGFTCRVCLCTDMCVDVYDTPKPCLFFFWDQRGNWLC